MTDTHAEISNVDANSAGHSASAGVGGAPNTDTVGVRVRDGGGQRYHAPVGAGVTAIPGSIVKAICAIKITVEAVKKSQRNQHGGYQFSSTDDVYAALARKMGEVGLICLPLEVESEIKRIEKDGRTSQWLRVVYRFVLATETDTWSDPSNVRTLCVQVTGPQTFQAAQSFAEKAYLRSMFKLPSGDMDLDSMPQADSEEEINDILAPRKKKSSSAAKKDGTDVVFNELRGAVSGADGPADLQLIKQQNWAVWETLPRAWRQLIDAEFDDRMAEFEQMEPAQ